MSDLDNDVATQISTAWDATIIAKPSIYVGDKKGFSTAAVPRIFVRSVEKGNINLATINNTAFIRERTAEVLIEATNETDLYKYIQNVNNAILSKSISGGMWDLLEFTDGEQHNHNYYQVFVKETLFMLKTEW